MNASQVHDALVNSGLVAGMRGNFPPETALRVAETLIENGQIVHFEFTMNSVQPIEAMQAVKRAFGDRVYSGMGTVLDADTAKRVIDAGADFMVSPAFQREVVQAALDAGVFIAPGVMTPTECVAAWSMGANMLKIFPIGVLGIEYFKAVRAPLDDMDFMCNGGMSDQNVGAFLAAGAKCCGMAGWLTGDGSMPLETIAKRARALRDIVTSTRTGVVQQSV